jgi:hypothetical protein
MVWIPLANGSGQVVKGIKLKNPESGKTKTVVATSRKGINRYEITFDDGSKVFNHEVRKTNKRPGWQLVGDFHTPEELAKIYNRKKVDPDSNLPRPERASFWKMKSKPGTHNYRQKKKLMQDPIYIKKFSQFFNDTLEEEIALEEATRSPYFKAAIALRNAATRHDDEDDKASLNWHADQLKSRDPAEHKQSAERMANHDTYLRDTVSDIVHRNSSKANSAKYHKIAGVKRNVQEETLEEGPKDAAGKDVFVKKIAKSAGVGYKAAGAIAAAAGRKRLGNKEFQRRVNAGQKAAAAARARGEKYEG